MRTVRHLIAVAAVWAALAWLGEVGAQGVVVPTPGAPSAATGPNALNPSAAASDTRNPNAFNPSAAPSAVTSPNALNPSATPSAFAPNVTAPNVLTPAGRQGFVTRRLRRGPGRAARTRRGGASAQASGLAEAARASDRRARSIVGSVCRGC